MKTGKSKETLFAEERQAQILKTLKAEHKVFVPALCELFDVSPVTIRNDLNYMQEKGLLKRTHGGAVLKSKIGYEENVAEKLSKNQRQKEKIAELAVSYVEDGDIIALDTGTTMLAFAKKLTEKKNLTIVTNDLNIAAYFDSNKEDITVILLGGVLRKKHGCTLGGMTLNGLEGLRVDKCFLATNGLTGRIRLVNAGYESCRGEEKAGRHRRTDHSALRQRKNRPQCICKNHGCNKNRYSDHRFRNR